MQNADSHILSLMHYFNKKQGCWLTAALKARSPACLMVAVTAKVKLMARFSQNAITPYTFGQFK